MIHRLKGLDFENKGFECHDVPTYTGEILPSQTSNP